VDVAARFFVYKLYDATRGNPVSWHPVRAFREAAATVSRAVERGWVVVRDEGNARAKQPYALLTDEGRLWRGRDFADGDVDDASETLGDQPRHCHAA
jgi:hypothetical protein